MRPNLKAVVAATSRSPEREALALAIEAKRAADAKLDAQRSAVARAERLVGDAQNKLNAATAAVAAERDRQARRLAEAVAAGRSAPAGGLRATRLAQTEAEDDAAASEAAAEQLVSALADREGEAADAELGLELAISSVLATVAPELVAAAEAHRVELLSLLSILFFIRRRGSSRHGTSGTWSENPTLSRPLAAVAAEIDAALAAGMGAWDANAALAHPIVNRWQEFCEALREGDADANLPA